MKKIYNSDDMQGTHVSANVEKVLTVVDKQLAKHGLEVVYNIKGEEIVWRLQASEKGTKSSSEYVHKSGATIRSISSRGTL